MDELNTSFQEIVRSLLLTYRHSGRIHSLTLMGSRCIREFDGLIETQTPWPGYQCSGIFYPGTDQLMYAHNTHGPASGAYYYLFDCRVHQRDWFLILNMTEQEQLIHLLKWGPQP